MGQRGSRRVGRPPPHPPTAFVAAVSATPHTISRPSPRNYWAYASWYVSSAHGSHFSPVVTVQTGDIVTGNNTVLPDGTWVIASTAPGRTNSTLTFKPVAGNWGTAYHVLEAYGVTTVCNLYPREGAVNFTNVAASFNGKAASPLAWQFMTQVRRRSRAARACDARTSPATPPTSLRSARVPRVAVTRARAPSRALPTHISRQPRHALCPLAPRCAPQTAGCGEHAAADAAGDAVQIIFNTA